MHWPLAVLPDEVIVTLKARSGPRWFRTRLPWLVTLVLLAVLPLSAASCGGSSGKQRSTAAAARPTTATLASATVDTSASPAASQATDHASPPSSPAATSSVKATPAANSIGTPLATPVAQGPTPTPTLPPHGQTALVPILMYHYVRPSPGPSDPIGVDLSVPPKNFEEQMAWLSLSGFTTMTMHELEEVRAKKIGLPRKPIVLTFDDGYRDFFTSVFPLLKKYHLKATAYIITGFVGKPAYMTWNMIKDIDKSGLVDVGAHTVTHPDLSQLSDVVATDQIVNSKKALAQHLGHPVWDFAYPSGDYTSATVQILQQVGLQTAVTTENRWSRASDPPLQLPRVRVHGQVTIDEYKAMLQ